MTNVVMENKHGYHSVSTRRGVITTGSLCSSKVQLVSAVGNILLICHETSFYSDYLLA